MYKHVWGTLQMTQTNNNGIALKEYILEAYTQLIQSRK